MKLLIIADDFTGALDTGVQLSKNNISTCVYVNSDNIPQNNQEAEVVVINGNLRHLEPGLAYSKTQEILKKMYTPGLYVYLKTDSVLRGNISAVFAAAIDYIKMPLYFIPAFPDLKRTTKNGTAYVNGALLENSVFAMDPRTPATTSNIHEIINRDYESKITDINIEKTDLILSSKTTFNTAKDTIYLFDCENNEQLYNIGSLIDMQNGYHFTAGCAGFAATFTKHIIFRHEKHNITKSSEPVLFISGSANAVTFAQLKYAKENNYHLVCLADEFNSILKSGIDKSDSSIRKLTADACSSLRNQKSVIFATATDKSELLDMDNLHKIGKNDEQIHNCIASYTSNLVKSILDNSLITNIVIFGGDMVAAILEKLEISKVSAAGEIATGVPLCQITAKDRTINLVTKSGGFGEPDLIPLIEKYLTDK